MRILFAGSMLLLTACSNIDSSDVAQTEIYTSYNAEYDDEEGTLRVNAHFTVGGGVGTDVVLDNDSSVSFDGQELRRDIGLFGNVGYSLQRYRPDFQELNRYHDIEYLDNSGRSYHNTVRIPRAVQGYLQSVDPYGDLVINWSTEEALSPQESVTASIKSRYGNEQIVGSSMYGPSSGQIIFRRGDWYQMAGQDVVVTICRRRSTSSVTAPPAGGYLSAQYCARKISASLPNR